jgi:ferritin-like metal-binding protein YciE
MIRVVAAKAILVKATPAKAILVKATPDKAILVRVIPDKAILIRAILVKAIPVRVIPDKAILIRAILVREIRTRSRARAILTLANEGQNRKAEALQSVAFDRNLGYSPRFLYCSQSANCQQGNRPMAKVPKTLDDLFHDTLKDIYFAEKKILATLPKMAKAAQNEELSAAFEKHRAETEGHVERLEEVFAMIEKKPQGKTCDAIVGITDEGAEIMKQYKGTPALDAGLLAAAQAVEHYEISRYGTLRTWAEELGRREAASLLQETLNEEKATDEALTRIAERVVNQEAEAA